MPPEAPKWVPVTATLNGCPLTLALRTGNVEGMPLHVLVVVYDINERKVSDGEKAAEKKLTDERRQKFRNYLTDKERFPVQVKLGESAYAIETTWSNVELSGKLFPLTEPHDEYHVFFVRGSWTGRTPYPSTKKWLETHLP